MRTHVCACAGMRQRCMHAQASLEVMSIRCDLMGTSGEVCEVRGEDDGASPAQQQPLHSLIPHTASHARVQGGERRILTKGTERKCEKERKEKGQRREVRGRGQGNGKETGWDEYDGKGHGREDGGEAVWRGNNGRRWGRAGEM